MDENKNVNGPSQDNEAEPFIVENGKVPSLEEEPIKFGWGRFHPDCLQFLNNPKCFLVCLLTYTLFQAVCVMGLMLLALPSVEKRFSLTGKEMGLIAAANDVSAIVLVVFISFYGDYGNKIKWIAGGGILVGLGSLLFALPHLLIGKYQPNIAGVVGEMCYSGGKYDDAQMKCNMESDSRWYYMAIFIVSQLITGVGIAPFYSLVPAYLDENVQPKSMPVYLAFWQFALFMGPGAGMPIAGKFLSIYVDIEQPAGMKLTAADPRWVGAWWLGFVIFGILILISCAILMGFPRQLPGAAEIRRLHIAQGNLRKADQVTKPSLRTMLPQLKALLTNWTLLFNTLGSTATMLYVSAIMPFYAKILQMKFGLLPEQTGYLMAVIFTPGVAVGVIAGAVMIRKFPLKTVCKRAALLIMILRIAGVIGPLSFVISGCKNIELAGMTTLTTRTTTASSASNAEVVSSLPESVLSTSCNTRCHCSLSRFSPVCGSDGNTYFDACHAGCKARASIMAFTNCSCIDTTLTNKSEEIGTAKYGVCDLDCKNFISFSVMLSINILIQFAKMVPDKTVILRCVPDNKRAFATGIQYMFTKTLGMLPGPILFGHVIDISCTLWQDTCGEKGRCFVYDVDKLSTIVVVFGVVITVISTVFYFFSWYLYKPEEKEALDGKEILHEVFPEKEVDSWKETRL